MDKYSLRTDRELVKLLNNGDYDAFSEIRRRYKSSLFTITHKRTSDLAASTVIVENILEETWNARNGISSIGELEMLLADTIKASVVKFFLIKNGLDEHLDTIKAFLIGLGAFLDENAKKNGKLCTAEIGSIHKEVVQIRTSLRLS
ncbi:MAG: hypothetical protein P0Y49_13840 [Candidatus Pedobacter colombiensis]|uniref:Uncharacterized protein n=1 Tax=Candidatus Pedobacter colombiensis TaxID=3121371 RepID=A0AAJ6B5V0_9SPHI|nr:hypothetical protein [Pedobacter sp.]WEK17881.1 MAG: hypothetical protein P0Y49_13840 [Pedobacter sp.]